MFKIIIEKKADKILRSFNAPIRMHIAEEILGLSTRFMDGKRLTGHLEGCRSYRVGDYRILYDVEFEKKSVKILHIDHRSQVYRKK
jgi:mRNA interferase RelE/StbE